MEIAATLNTAVEPECEAADYLSQVDHTLEQLEEHGLDDQDPSLTVHKRYDLCPACYRHFLKDPFGSQKKVVPFGFSHN